MKIRLFFSLLMAGIFVFPALAQSSWYRKYDAAQIGIEAIWPNAFGALHEIAPDTFFWYATNVDTSSDRKLAITSPYASEEMRPQAMVANMLLFQTCAVQNEAIRRKYMAIVAVDCPEKIVSQIVPNQWHGKVYQSCAKWLRSASSNQKIPGALWEIIPLHSALEMEGIRVDTNKPGVIEKRTQSFDTRKICTMNLNGEPLKSLVD
jgi:hypothetical protein